MSTSPLTIRNLPPDVVETIRQRARRSGESMQTYVWKCLVADASRPTPSEFVDRLGVRMAAGGYPNYDLEVDQLIADGQM
jgi:plasmid stability protein